MTDMATKPDQSTLRRKGLYLTPIILLLLGACLIRIFDPTPLVRMRVFAFDSFQRLKPRIYDPSLPVRIVDIDDSSLAALGQWPLPRSLIADLVVRLKDLGAAVIAFDVMFPEPDRLSPANLLKQLPKTEATDPLAAQILALPSNDKKLAEALSAAPAILEIAGTSQGEPPDAPAKAEVYAKGPDPRPYLPAFKGATRSLPELVSAASGEGALNWTPEFDQVVRRVPLAVVIGHHVWPALAAETMRLLQPHAAYAIVTKDFGVSSGFGLWKGATQFLVGSLDVPVDLDCQLWLHHTSHDPRRFISAYKVLEGGVDRSEIQGRVILIGTSAAGLNDTRTTPLEDAIAGVEIHAQTIEQMLLGDHLIRPGYMAAIETGAAFVVGVVLILILARSGALAGALAGGLSVAGAFLVSWVAYSRHGILADAVYPVTVLTGLYIAGTVQRYFSTERERNRVRRAFEHYLAPALVEQLARDPSRLELGGQLRQMTVLFSDVRNFTEISEKLDAPGVTRFLNQLLTPVSDTILSHGGTIDKYMGDAVMAFWNAPLEEPEHARKASLAALRMQEDVKELNDVLKAEAQAQGRAHTPVMIGIGLNTGPCCVGNLGTARRFDYSVVGDSVNVASRLEGQCKIYGVGIIAGASVAEAARDLAFLEIDLVKVKGRQEPIRIYTLLGGAEVKSSAAFQTLADLHAEGLSAFRTEDFEQARAILARARALGVKALFNLYDFYEKRLSELEAAAASTDREEKAAPQARLYGS